MIHADLQCEEFLAAFAKKCVHGPRSNCQGIATLSLPKDASKAFLKALEPSELRLAQEYPGAEWCARPLAPRRAAR